VHLPKGFFFLKTPKLGVLKCEEFDLEYNEILSNQKVFLEPEWGGVLSTKKKKTKTLEPKSNVVLKSTN
jgi:hypothetical protein